MSHNRNTKYLDDKRIVYRRDPITDKPTVQATYWDHYQDGTYECYTLFASKAKITTYKSLKWHLLVIWYLNPGMDQDEFMDVALAISAKTNGFVSFNMPPDLLRKIVYDVSMQELKEPPKNKLRKVIFKVFSGLTKEEKLRVVGQLIGRSNKVHPDDVYQAMIDIHDLGQKITIRRISDAIHVSPRTVYRYMCEDLKREKELLNKEL